MRIDTKRSFADSTFFREYGLPIVRSEAEILQNEIKIRNTFTLQGYHDDEVSYQIKSSNHDYILDLKKAE